MASSGWQGNKDFPYNNTDLKCNLRIDSITHSGDSLRVIGAVGAVCPHSSSAYYAWYVYPVYVTPQGGGETTLLTDNENVYGGGNNGLDSAKTVGFDVAIPVSAASTSANFAVHVRMNNNTAEGDLTWPLSFDASLPPAPTCSAGSSTKNNISFNYSAGTNGLNTTLQYQLDSGSWVDIATSTSTISGTKTIGGLLPNSSHTIRVRSVASGSTVNGNSISLRTTDTPAKGYVSVSGKAKRAKKVYCSVNGAAKKVKKVYGSVNGVAKICYEDPNL